MLSAYQDLSTRVGQRGIAVRELGPTGSRSTPATAGTPICCASVPTAEWGNSALAPLGGGRPRPACPGLPSPGRPLLDSRSTNFGRGNAEFFS